MDVHRSSGATRTVLGVVGVGFNKALVHTLDLARDQGTAIIDAGLRIEFLHEFPVTPFEFHPMMEKVDDKMMRLTDHDGCMPLVYSIIATKLEAGG
mgnify:CR=1 FL=1